MLTLVVSLLVLATAIVTVLVITAGPLVKPATEHRQPHRADPPSSAAPPEARAAPAPEARMAQTPVRRVTVAPPTGRFRSAAVLVLLVVVLGAVVALVIAAVLAALGLSLRQAVT